MSSRRPTPAVWAESRNAHAAALYLFSAGHPATVRAVLDRHAAFTPEGDRLVKGALAYAEGQDDTARALLGTFDPKSLPVRLGGHLALVMATLLADKEPVRASAMLDAARLLVPGTLVEEAALRRQIFLLADAATIDKFASLSRQYVHRYRSSVFAANFKARLTSFAVRLAVAGEVAQLSKLEPVFVELPQAERRAIYLTLARDALVGGRPRSHPATRRRAPRHCRPIPARPSAPSSTPPRLRRLRTPPPRHARRWAPSTGAACRNATSNCATRPRRSRPRSTPAWAIPAQDMAASPPDSPAAALFDRGRRAMADSDALLAVDLGRPGPSSVPPRAGATP